jgi:quinol monooxygenase YgiN
VIVIAGRMRLDPSCYDAALAAMRPVIDATRKEPGNVEYRYFADLDDATTLFLFEEWESEAALAAHFEQPYVVDFLAQLPTLGILEAEVNKYTVGDKGPMS